MVPSPVGELTLVARGTALVAILWENDKPNRVRLGQMRVNAGCAVLQETARQLGEYFTGTRQQFDVPLDFHGTPFQQEVWRALLTIPYGQTRSYGEIARQIGRPAAVRAANGKNPISIIAPCHRVIGATGELTGFAGGLHAKVSLLALEGITLSSDREALKTGHARRRAVHIDTAQGCLF
ncbi:methylated-DNA--[protein]-cysteine S-methyltransferase [Janthinobacterium sp. LB3P118]|uniref:methylated-DNA--[protein]-cysteine S-methyltransferase n=1 Tax=Janthinobacterium sp. LB3P118 TaxID=3424195 RepID=UPI003F284224